MPAYMERNYLPSVNCNYLLRSCAKAWQRIPWSDTHIAIWREKAAACLLFSPNELAANGISEIKIQQAWWIFQRAHCICARLFPLEAATMSIRHCEATQTQYPSNRRYLFSLLITISWYTNLRINKKGTLLIDLIIGLILRWHIYISLLDYVKLIHFPTGIISNICSYV